MLAVASQSARRKHCTPLLSIIRHTAVQRPLFQDILSKLAPEKLNQSGF